MSDARYLSYGNPMGATSAPSFTNFALNGTTDQAEFIVQMPDGVTLTQAGIRLGTITGTTPTYRISLQGVDASGNPDGTIKGGGTPASKTFSPSGLSWSNSSWHWLILDNSYACSRGEYLAVVVDYSSGTVDGSNNASFSVVASAPTLRNQYGIQNDAGSRTRQTNGYPPVGLASASKAYVFPSLSFTSQAFNSGSSTDEYAVKFTIPTGWGESYKLVGARFAGAFSAGATSKMILYSGSDTTPANSTGGTSEATVQQDVTFDHDFVNTTSVNSCILYFDEASLVTLYEGATYRLAFQPQSGTNMTIVWQDIDAVADWDAFIGGQDITASSRVNTGTWTDTTTRKLLVDLIFSDLSKPQGGGGHVVVIGSGHGPLVTE